MKTQENGDADESNRQRRRMMADSESGDDVGGVTGFRRARDFLNRAVAHRRVIVRNRHDDCGHDQADEGCEIKLCRRARRPGDR